MLHLRPPPRSGRRLLGWSLRNDHRAGLHGPDAAWCEMTQPKMAMEFLYGNRSLTPVSVKLNLGDGRERECL